MPLGEDSTLSGRYRLLSQIGRGGMGTVWHAHDDFLDRDVAVKAVRFAPELTSAEVDKLYQRTLREARLAARLSHPAIVTIHDVIEEDNRPWIIMEMIHARSLREHIDQDGPLDPLRVATIGLQIAKALTVAHGAGILHLDVKPSNVLLDVSRSDRAVLADFGIARAHSDSTTTQIGALSGSPAYIAPERLAGRPAATASDLWSLGATLYDAVEGWPPFERPEPLASLIAVVNDHPAPMRKAGPLRPLIEGLLTKDPGERLTAAAAMAMLERIIAGDSEPARFTSSGMKGARSAGRDAPVELAAHQPADRAVRTRPSAKPRRARLIVRAVLPVATLLSIVADVIIIALR
jgi:serine/threonine protein kinase